MSEEEDVRKQAIEIWSSISDEEFYIQEYNRDGSLEIIRQNYQIIVDILIRNLMQIEAEDEEAFDSALIDASQIAAICISKMTSILQDLLLLPLTNYAFDQLTNANWKKKYGALLLLASGLKSYNNSENICNYLSDKMPLLLELLNDPSFVVQKSAALVFKFIAEKASFLLGDERVLNYVFSKSIEGIKNSKSELATIYSEVIMNIAE